VIRKEYSSEASSEDGGSPPEAPPFEISEPSSSPSAPPPSGDAEALRHFVASADGESFERLVRSHERLVMGVCVRVLGNRHAAEDAFQETFLSLAKRAATIRDPGSLAGWLHRVASNEALRLRIQSQRRAAREAAVEMEAVVPPPAPEDRQVFALIDETLGELPDKYRLPLVLRYMEGLSTDTAARRLGRPKGSMSTLIARGLELLRTGLHEKGVAVTGGLLLSALTALAAQGQAAAPALIASVVRSAVPAAGLALAANLKTMIVVALVAAGAVGTGLLLPEPALPDLPTPVIETFARQVAPAPKPPDPADLRPAPLPPTSPAADVKEAEEAKDVKKASPPPPSEHAAGPPEALPPLPDLPETASDKARDALKHALERRTEKGPHAGPSPQAASPPFASGLDRAREASRGALNAAERAQQAAQQTRGRSGK
jgi:RNA polymerase sigma factor (sigma-70 family)